MADEEHKPTVHQFSRTKTVGAFPDIKTKDERTDEENEAQRKRMIIENILFALIIMAFETFIVTIYAIWFNYADEEAEHEMELYPYFRDVNIMIFFGFGFLMTFLRRYGYSAIGYSFLMGCIAVQWSLILNVFFVIADGDFNFDVRQGISIEILLNALFCAGAILISYGAYLGKTTPLQMVIMAILEPMGYWVNIFIIIFKLEAIDVGECIPFHSTL
jgi:ammonium transporter Rh